MALMSLKILHQTGVYQQLLSACRKALHEFSMIPPRGDLAIALSGGKDSLTLLHLLHEISGRGFPPFKILAIYVGGEFSCGANIQVPYLQDICKKMDIELIIKESQQKLEHLECYRCSRERRKLIFDTAKEKGISHIAFGHHKDDQIQTLLLNLFHKAEFSTLLPKILMHRYDVTLIRPLIYITEQQIIHFAKQQEFYRITCQCPIGQNSKRKKTDELLKLIEQEFPNVRGNLFQAGLQYGSKKATKI